MLAVPLQQALARKGQANFFQTLEVMDLLLLQVRGLFGPGKFDDQQYLYCAGLKARYIGRGAFVRKTALFGMLSRYLEHLRNWHKVSQRLYVQNCARYASLLKADGRLHFYFVLFEVVPAALAAGEEAARIFWAQPEGNNIETLLGRPGSSAGKGQTQAAKSPKNRRRRQRGRKRKLSDILAGISCREPVFQQHSLEKLVRRHKCLQKHRERVKSTSRLLSRPFLVVYDHFGRVWRQQQAHSLGHGSSVEGPLCIYSPGFLPLLVRYACLRTKEINWKFALASRNVASDFLYVIWEFCSVLPHFCDRIKVRASLSSMITSLNMPTPRVFLFRVPCQAWLSYCKRWLRHVSKLWGFYVPFWAALLKERPNLFLYLILR